MRLTGQMYELDDLDGYQHDVKEAVITNSRIAMDWDEDGEPLHAILHSEDGGTEYRGSFGSPEPDPASVVEATRFTAKNGAVLLWIQWHRKDNGAAGHCIVHLASDWE